MNARYREEKVKHMFPLSVMQSFVNEVTENLNGRFP